jgi:hypothetical protein
VTKIREDEHGVYVRTGGYLFRPQRNERYRNHFRRGDALGFPVETEVKARHIGGTELAKVNDQTWFSYGMYKGRASCDLWEGLPPEPTEEERVADIEARAAVHEKIRAILKPRKIINIIDKGN